MIHFELANAENIPEKFHDRVHQTETSTGAVIKIEANPKDVFHEMLAMITFFENSKQYRPLFMMALATFMTGEVKACEQIDLLKEMDA